MSGYFDSMGIVIMAGECWTALTNTVPGYKPLDLKNLIHVGMCDVSVVERERVLGAGFPVIWARSDSVDFAQLLKKRLGKYPISPATVHVDLDCLGSIVGQANKYKPEVGGLSESE